MMRPGRRPAWPVGADHRPRVETGGKDPHFRWGGAISPICIQARQPFCRTTGISANRHSPGTRRISCNWSRSTRSPSMKTNGAVRRAQQIIDMLVGECRAAGAELRLGAKVLGIEVAGEGYLVDTGSSKVACQSVVIATRPVIQDWRHQTGYDIASQFGLKVTAVRPALVPFQAAFLERCRALSGLSVDAEVSLERQAARGLFTHRAVRPVDPSDQFLG